MMTKRKLLTLGAAAATLSVAVPSDSAAEDAEAKPEGDARSAADTVADLFDEMRDGEYRRALFPSLTKQHIPHLLEIADDTSSLKSFPVNPLSSQSQDSCTAGMAALWLIEGIRDGGKFFPSLNPILVAKSGANPPADAARENLMAEAQKRAAEAYKDWWARYESSRKATGFKRDPLQNTGLAWR